MKISITKIHLTCLVLSCLVLSCQNEPVGLTNDFSTNSKNGTVINGRFFFASKEKLKQAIEQLKSLDNKTLELKFEKLYQQGFRSHTPIVNPNNELLLSKLDGEFKPKENYEKKSFSSKISVSDEEEDNSIGDPFFGAVVNKNNEIIVGDSLYKISKELGVLSVKVKDSTHLYDYLSKLNTSVSKTSKLPLDVCTMRTDFAGNTEIDPYISRYIAPAEGDCYAPTPPTPVFAAPQISQEQELQNQINNLAVCEGEDTSLLNYQSLFGTNRSCINYFDSKHRIKTEFWNQNWTIYASVGVQVRTQVKRVWVWWASDADEIHMGINRIYLKYNFPDPEINSELYLNTFYTKPEVPVYMYKGEFKILTNNYGNYIYPTFIKANTALPFFDFKKGTDMLNIYIRKLPYLDNYNIRSEGNIKELYKLGIDFLKSNYNNDASKEFVVSYQKNQSEVEVIYFGERYKDTNDNDLKKTFYRDTEFLIGITYNPDGGSVNSSTGNSNGSFKYSFGPPKHSNFRNYTDYEIDFYGLARMGSTWSGNRMQNKN